MRVWSQTALPIDPTIKIIYNIYKLVPVCTNCDRPLFGRFSVFIAVLLGVRNRELDGMGMF